MGLLKRASGIVIPNVHNRVGGRYKFEAVRLSKSGKEVYRRPLTGWFNNIITNEGLEAWQSIVPLNYCQVGAGNTPALATDTVLDTHVATNTSLFSWSSGTQSIEPYFAWFRRIYRFAEGTATGNLAEVGISWQSGVGTLFSRALILDEFGEPTTITILSNETLDVTYELRYYPLITDIIGSVFLDGNKGGTYDYIMRASRINSTLGLRIASQNTRNMSFGSSTYAIAYSGDIGAITSTSSGTNSIGGTISIHSYVPYSYTQAFTMPFALHQGNFVGGIRSLLFTMGCSGYQLQFDPPVPKTSDDEFSLTVQHTWGRV